MSLIDGLEREKVLYEIAMSIGNSLDLERMTKEVLSTLLRKLSCTSGAIFQAGEGDKIGFDNLVLSIPKRISKNMDYIGIIEKLNSENGSFPAVGKVEKGQMFYIFQLQNFGYLALIRDGEMEELILRSLSPILYKIANSANACIQNSQLIEKTEQLKISLEEVKAANRAKSQFLANMSHEIRTPLNGIVGFLDLLKRTDTTPQQNSYIDIINSSSETLLEIINDILDFSKIEAGKMDVEFVAFDFLHESQMIFELFKKRARDKGLRFIASRDVFMPQYIVLDKIRIKQIFVNLINNAIKFTPNGSVTVEIEVIDTLEDSVTWRISVIDTGIGIPEDKIEKILEPFTQSNESDTRKYGGTGLGLSITKNLIELMGGELKIESEVDKGSNFFFELTSKIASGVERADEVEDKNLEFTGRLLVAEDNIVNQLLISEILSQMNLEFDLVNNGQEAVDKFEKEESFDLILMDHNMPILDGAGALEKIRQYEERESLQHIPVVVLTANALKGDRERFINELKFDDYLSKPLDREKLNRVFSKFLRCKQEE
jgi:signal transduction histidine kinase